MLFESIVKDARGRQALCYGEADSLKTVINMK